MARETGRIVRSRSARQSARDQLLQLRQARMRKRSAAASPAHGDPRDAMEEPASPATPPGAVDHLDDGCPQDTAWPQNHSDAADDGSETVAFMPGATEDAPFRDPEPLSAAAPDHAFHRDDAVPDAPDGPAPEVTTASTGEGGSATVAGPQPAETTDPDGRCDSPPTPESTDADHPDVPEATATLAPEGVDEADAAGGDPYGAAQPAPPGDAGGPDTDLADLPGAGPGLVWLLQRAGIADQAALAEADPDALAASLGVVGDVLDLGYWIEHARKRGAA